MTWVGIWAFYHLIQARPKADWALVGLGLTGPMSIIRRSGPSSHLAMWAWSTPFFQVEMLLSIIKNTSSKERENPKVGKQINHIHGRMPVKKKQGNLFLDQLANLVTPNLVQGL